MVVCTSVGQGKVAVVMETRSDRIGAVVMETKSDRVGRQW